MDILGVFVPFNVVVLGGGIGIYFVLLRATRGRTDRISLLIHRYEGWRSRQTARAKPRWFHVVLWSITGMMCALVLLSMFVE